MLPSASRKASPCQPRSSSDGHSHHTECAAQGCDWTASFSRAKMWHQLRITGACTAPHVVGPFTLLLLMLKALDVPHGFQARDDDVEEPQNRQDECDAGAHEASAAQLAPTPRALDVQQHEAHDGSAHVNRD